MADYTAASAAYADVAVQIALATTGDRVLVPAGTATWSTAFNIPAGVTLEGAGVTTEITCSVASSLGTARLFSSSVIKNFKMIGSTSNPCFGISPGAQGWRITGITYTTTAANSYFLNFASSGATWGLIDNCTITSSGSTSELVYTRGPTDAWDTASTFGTDQAVYVEDCTFNGPGYVSDFNSNAKAVVRFCTITGQMKIDAHGLSTNNPARSCRGWECYENTWTAGSGVWTAMELRGGTGYVFNNTANPGSLGGSLKLVDYVYQNSAPFSNFDYLWRTPEDYPTWQQIGRGQFATAGDRTSATSEPAYCWGNLRNSALWPISTDTVYAGRTFTTNAALYPVGSTSIVFTGSTDLHAGNYIAITGDNTRYLITAGRTADSQAITISPPLVQEIPAVATTMKYGPVPHYQGQTSNPTATFTSSQMITANRDYFNEVAAFNGSSGVGIGTRAQMLAITPTLPGVGFWVTDEGNWNATAAADESGQLYTWSGSAWVLKYVPYTYPHPLRGALAAPTFTLQPANRTTEEGLPTVFTCTASANPSPTYQWRKGGVAISGATSATYTITITQLGDAGTYDCVATNSQGSTTSSSATLSVDALTPGTPPTFTVQPDSVSANETDDAHFTAAATGDPTPTLQWRKGGVALVESARIVGVTTGSLSILEVTEADEGIYDCVATSTAGSASSTGATLIVNQVGYQPSTPSVLGNRGTRARRLGIF